MEPSDELLLQAYSLGFDLELDGKASYVKFEHLLISKAFNLGKSDALLGDDNTSLDYQSDEQILKRIKDADNTRIS
jgi:hypothetical protein